MFQPWAPPSGNAAPLSGRSLALPLNRWSLRKTTKNNGTEMPISWTTTMCCDPGPACLSSSSSLATHPPRDQQTNNQSWTDIISTMRLLHNNTAACWQIQWHTAKETPHRVASKYNLSKICWAKNNSVVEKKHMLDSIRTYARTPIYKTPSGVVSRGEMGRKKAESCHFLTDKLPTE